MHPEVARQSSQQLDGESTIELAKSLFSEKYNTPASKTHSLLSLSSVVIVVTAAGVTTPVGC